MANKEKFRILGYFLLLAAFLLWASGFFPGMVALAILALGIFTIFKNKENSSTKAIAGHLVSGLVLLFIGMVFFVMGIFELSSYEGSTAVGEYTLGFKVMAGLALLCVSLGIYSMIKSVSKP